jgi:hypothetical protein
LQTEMFDEHGREALLVLDLHAIEDTAIRVDADEGFFGRAEIPKNLCWIHCRISKFQCAGCFTPGFLPLAL